MTTRLPDCLRAALLLAGLGLAASPRAAAQTQAVLTAQTCTELRQADAELNRLYQQVLKLYAQRPTFLVPFKASQVAWLRFRDAQAEALYPATAAGRRGSAAPMCRCTTLADLTTARNAQLKQWVEGKEEGDVCGNTIRTR